MGELPQRHSLPQPAHKRLLPLRTAVPYPKAATSVDFKLLSLENPSSLATNNQGENSMATKDDLDNHTDQLNPNNDAYWESRGWDERPDDWEDRQDSGDLLPAG